MKKAIITAALILAIMGTVSAQAGWGNWGTVQTMTIEGTLQFQNGNFVIVSGSNVFITPLVARLVGFAEGVVEGARVTAVGAIQGNVLHLTNLTVGGRTYDFAANTGTLAASDFYCCWGWNGGQAGRNNTNWGGMMRHHRGRW